MLNLTVNENEPAFVRRRKQIVQRRYKNTRSETIEHASELAVYLHAIGNDTEAEALLDSFCTKSPWVEHRPERWYAVGQAIVHNAYLKSSRGEAENSEKLLQLIREHDYQPLVWIRRDYFAELLPKAANGLKGLEPYSKHQHCQALAQSILFVFYGMFFRTEDMAGYEAAHSTSVEDELMKLLQNLARALS